MARHECNGASDSQVSFELFGGILDRMVIWAAVSPSADHSESFHLDLSGNLPGLSSAVPVACSVRTVVPLATRAWISDMTVMPCSSGPDEMNTPDALGSVDAEQRNDNTNSKPLHH